MSDNMFDYIIVGAGTAGCLLANRLSRDPSLRVLLIEAGGKDDYHWIHIPVGYLYCIDNPRTDWRFRTEAEIGLQGRQLLYPRGKVLGGSSSINGMIYMRGQARDYDHWAELTGDADWSWDNVLPDFARHEDHHLGGDNLHGAGGEWRVEKQRLRWDILDAFAKAAEQAGIPATSDFNRGDNEGVGYFEVNQRNGWRWSAAKGFLHPIRHRPNLTVWTGRQAARLSIDGENRRCRGVDMLDGGQAIARREVILSAGAVGSPHLLQLSGIGPAGLLRRHGVAILQDLPGVGANLQDHLQLRTVFSVKGAATLNRLAAHWWGKAAIGLRYALTRTGPMSMAPSQLGIFTRSDPGRPHPNIEFHVQPLSLEAFGKPLDRKPAITASVCNLNPTSRGTVTLKSGRAEDAPAIAPCYLSTDADRKVAADSIRIARHIAAQPAFAAFAPIELKPGPDITDDQSLADAAGRIGTTIFHPVGTARMGRPQDPAAVVDSRLRVLGMKGLRVVDASVMPTITSGNTNSPVLMIAEKAAKWIGADASAI